MLAGTAAGSSCFSTNHEAASRPPRFHASYRIPRESLTVTTIAAEAVTPGQRNGYSPRRGKCNTWLSWPCFEGLSQAFITRCRQTERLLDLAGTSEPTSDQPHLYDKLNT
jgi:hypothetical protein